MDTFAPITIGRFTLSPCKADWSIVQSLIITGCWQNILNRKQSLLSLKVKYNTTVLMTNSLIIKLWGVLYPTRNFLISPHCLSFFSVTSFPETISTKVPLLYVWRQYDSFTWSPLGTKPVWWRNLSFAALPKSETVHLTLTINVTKYWKETLVSIQKNITDTKTTQKGS